MRTLNWKRFFILLLMLFALGCIALGSSAYFIDAEWISAQIKQASGYDIRFQRFENSWLSDRRLALLDVSLYHQQQPTVTIQRVDIQLGSLDLWQRRLDINNIHLSGVDIQLDLPVDNSSAVNTDSALDSEAAKQSGNAAIAWERLHLNSLRISDTNISITDPQQQLLVNGMSAELKDLLVINNQRLQLLPATLNALTEIKSIQFKDGKQQLQLNELKLLLKGDLLQRSGRLNIDVDKVELLPALQPAIQASAIQLALQLKDNHLDLQNLSLNALSGSLRMQADAMLAIPLLPKPELKVKQITVQSLLLQDMQFTIPDWQPAADNAEQSAARLPMETLLVEKLHLKDIDIGSENNSYPVLLKGLELQLLDLHVVQHHQWLPLEKYTEQDSRFSLYIDYVNWQEAVIEQFSLAGSLTENETNFLLLREQLSKP